MRSGLQAAARAILARVAYLTGPSDSDTQGLLWVDRIDFGVFAAGPPTPRQRTCCLAINPVVVGMIQALKGGH